MKIISFPEQTAVYAKNQPEYRPLPAFQHNDPQGRITCCWSLSWKERFKVVWTGRIWHSILTFRQPLQPQLLAVEKPNMEPHAMKEGEGEQSSPKNAGPTKGTI